MWKLRLSEAKQQLQCHHVSQQWRQDLNSVLPIFRSCSGLKSSLSYHLPPFPSPLGQNFSLISMGYMDVVIQLLLLPNFIISRPSRNFDIIVRTSLSSRILLSFCLQCPLHTAVSLSRPSPRLERTGDSWLAICFQAFHFNSSITQNCFL